MQTLRNIIAFVSFCLSVLLIQSPMLRAEDHTQTTVLTEENMRQQRPSMPSRQRVSCTYSRGHIELDFNCTEFLDVTISQDAIPVWSGTVTQDEPSADIPVLYGEHTITCITDGGQVFTGHLDF